MRWIAHIAAVKFPLLSAVLTVSGLALVIGPLLWAPHAHLYAFGGDAFVLYYDALYHVLHGAPGVTLDAMLYPRGELIFLTDAQGAWVVVWQWIHRNLVALTPESIVGSIHTANNLAVVLAGVVTYYAAVRLGARRLVAALLAPAVVLLSPQLLRIGGHFGLAYPYVVPLTLWWVLRYRARPDLTDLLITGALTFLTFNNPYVGFSAGLTLIVWAGLSWRALGQARTWIPPVGTLLALGSAYLTFKLLDPHDDRIELQWGALAFRTKIGGSLAPETSPLRRLLGVGGTEGFESAQYLGIVTIVALLGWLVYRLRRRGAPPLFPESVRARFLRYALAAGLVYLFCFDWPWSEGFGLALERRAGFLLMFKAVARLAWPAYWAAALAGISVVSYAATRLADPRWRYGVLALAVSVAYADALAYLTPRYRAFDNSLDSAALAATAGQLRDLGVEPGDVQAILSVPRQLSWNGNVLTTWLWHTHYHSVRTSLALGRPMINANLGRAPLGPLLDVTQLMSRPLVARAALARELLPTDGDVLLIRGADTDPTALPPGERFLLGMADSLGQLGDDGAHVYRLHPDSLRRDDRPLPTCGDSSAAAPLVHLGFDDDADGAAYAGRGALTVERGTTRLLDTVFRREADTLELLVALWVQPTKRRYGVGEVHVRATAPSGQVVAEQALPVREQPDAHDGYFLVEAAVTLPPGPRLSAEFAAPQALRVDELTVRRAGVRTVAPIDETACLIDGVRVESGA